mgnify:CR=1 FL=1
MSAQTIQPGINSTVTINNVSFPAAVSIESTEESERIDVTGFGDSVRTFTMGVLAATEITVRTYADPTGLSVGTQYANTSIEFGGANGREISGSPTVVSYSSSADVDGATVYEFTLLFSTV